MPLGGGWEEGALDSIGTLVILLDCVEVVKPVPEGGKLGEFLEVLGPDSLEVVDSFGDSEVSQGEVSEDPILLAEELVDEGDLSLDLLFIDLVLFLGVLVVEAELQDWGLDVVDHTDDVVNDGGVLGVLARELVVLALGDDVFADGIGLSQLELAVDQIGQVGEGDAQAGLVLAEPLLWGLVDLAGEGLSSVGQQKSWDLSTASNAPIAKSDMVHHFYDKDI